MKQIIKSKISLIIAVVGFVGAIIWAFQTMFDAEPIILGVVSLVEILGYLFWPSDSELNTPENKITNEQNINVNVSIGEALDKPQSQSQPRTKSMNRSAILNVMSSKTTILFIDDDNKFNVVKILKESGWKKTKTVIDIKTLDVPAVKDADIIFVDINGVGKLLGLEYEGLDLSLMLKQKYPEKKIIIYSANRNSNSFHEAWDLCDFKLEKNALPYQFQNLVEEYSIEKYNREQ